MRGRRRCKDEWRSTCSGRLRASLDRCMLHAGVPSCPKQVRGNSCHTLCRTPHIDVSHALRFAWHVQVLPMQRSCGQGGLPGGGACGA